MNTERIHNNEVYLDQNKGPNSTPIRHDDGAWSEDKNPLTTWTPSSSVATTVNDSVSGSRITPHRERRGEQALVAVLKQLLTLIDHRRRERRIRGATTANPGMGPSSCGGAADHTMSGLETDTVRFRRVAARSRALMDHRERRLEEAMSDPQRRTGLEAMFPGMKNGDYETLLAEVRGIEEDEFQALLAGSRKRRKEVRTRLLFKTPREN